MLGMWRLLGFITTQNIDYFIALELV